MNLDPVLLDRIQAGFTFAFHIIFPSFTIGLSAYVATLALMWIATGVSTVTEGNPAAGRTGSV